MSCNKFSCRWAHQHCSPCDPVCVCSESFHWRSSRLEPTAQSSSVEDKAHLNLSWIPRSHPEYYVTRKQKVSHRFWIYLHGLKSNSKAIDPIIVTRWSLQTHSCKSNLPESWQEHTPHAHARADRVESNQKVHGRSSSVLFQFNFTLWFTLENKYIFLTNIPFI